MTESLYLSRIGELLPDLFFHKVEKSSGQFHDTLIINREWVFRFPHYRDGVDQLSAEVDLLHALQTRLPLAVPIPSISSFSPPVPGLAVAGYRYIPGDPIDPEVLKNVLPAAQENLAGLLAGFLHALHELPLAGLPSRLPGGFPEEGFRAAMVRDLRPEWETMYDEVAASLFPVMRPDVRRSLKDHFFNYFDTPQLQEFTPCLRHGDFGGPNILWHRATGQIFGVIDFSSCAVGDPAMDLASASTLGSDFFERLAHKYEPDAQKREKLLSRVHFYSGLFALMEALDGMKYDDDDAYSRGMAAYL